VLVPVAAFGAFLSYGFIAFGERRETPTEGLAYLGAALGLTAMARALLTVILAGVNSRWAPRVLAAIALVAVAWAINFYRLA
jgi:hypothetical protein